jgi:DNA repair exonuclease SbcCD nuclease subunit
MSKPLVAVIADTQLHKRLYGLSETRQDWFDAFDSAITQVLSRISEVSAICMPGDILDKEEVGSQAAHAVLKGLKRLAAHPEVPVFILLGNHDQPEDGTALNWVHVFQLVHPNVIEPALTKPHYLSACPNGSYPALNIYGVHHQSKLVLTDTLLSLPSANPIPAVKESWLLLHQALKELAPHPDSFEVQAAQIPSWITKVILGDFHDMAVYEEKSGRQFIYPGSTETVSFNQSKTPGFIFINRSTNEITHHSTQQREYITVHLATLPVPVWKHALNGLIEGGTTRLKKSPILRVYYPADQWDIYSEIRQEIRPKVLHLQDNEEPVKSKESTDLPTKDSRLPSSRSELIEIACEELALLETTVKEDASKMLTNPAYLPELQSTKFPQAQFTKLEVLTPKPTSTPKV